MSRRPWLAAAGATSAAFALVGLLVACSSPAPRTDPKPAVPTFTGSARPTTSVPVATTAPTTCDGVAAATDIDKIVGHPLGGTVSQVIGVPMTSIGRTARLDCYYGVPDGQPLTSAVLSIGISMYSDPQSALARVTSTVTQAKGAGSAISTLKVNGATATVMVSEQNQALTMAAGSRTVTIAANTGVLPKGDDSKQLAALAQLGLTAHATN